MRLLTISLALALVGPLGLMEASPAAAQDDLVRTDPFANDPIGVGAPVAPADHEMAAAVARLRPEHGAVLTAIAGVREQAHATTVHLDGAIARIETRIELGSSARHAAEARYAMPVAAGAVLEALEVCDAQSRCRAGEADESGGETYDAAIAGSGTGRAAHAAIVDGILQLRVAPIAPRGTIALHVRYAAPVAIHGGIARLTLPARGSDPRLASGAFSAESTQLAAPSIDGRPAEDGALVVEPREAVEVLAHVPEGAPIEATVSVAPCASGRGRCAHATVTSGSQHGDAVDMILAIDASRSTRGPSRGRVMPTIAALLAAAPPGSTVRAVAFGATVETLISEPVDVTAAPLVTLGRATELDLGAATRFEALWSHAAPLMRGNRRALLLIVGDGTITTSAASDRALREAGQSRAPIAIVDVEERVTEASLRTLAERTRGMVLSPIPEADRAWNGRSTMPLEERVAVLYAPIVSREVTLRIGARRVALGELRAGESLAWQGAIPASGTVRLDGAGFTARPARGRDRVADGLASGESAVLSSIAGGVRSATGLAIAEDRDGPLLERIVAPAPVEAESTTGQGVPAETVLAMLRQRIVPRARECFRRDRRGRADYSVRAVLELDLADQEIASAGVSGEIEDELRACLAQTIDALDVPRFEGRIRVRYPLTTAREAPPPRIELVGDVATGVDRVIGTPQSVGPHILRERH